VYAGVNSDGKSQMTAVVYAGADSVARAEKPSVAEAVV